MEQVYVIKLKELPQPPRPPPTLATDTLTSTGEPTVNGIKLNSPLEDKDLNRQSLFGFSIFQLIFGFLSIIFSILGTYREWTHAFGVLTGIIYVINATAGIIVSKDRSLPFSSLSTNLPTSTSSTSLSWTSFSRSSTFLWIAICGHFITLIISTLFTWLTMFGVICSLNSTINLQISLITANGLQFIFSLFSTFTLCRILNPDFLIEYIPSWPNKPKVSSRIIVKTSIYPRVLKSGDFSRLLGPNCIVSLVPPNNSTFNRQVTIGSSDPPRMQDQSTETEPDGYFEEVNILSSTPKYFSRSTSSISSVSTASLTSNQSYFEPETLNLPTLGESPATRVKKDAESECEPESELESVPEVKLVENSKEESSPEPEKGQSSISTTSSEPDSDQDSNSNPECNSQRDQIECESIHQNHHHHHAIPTTVSTAIH